MKNREKERPEVGGEKTDRKPGIWKKMNRLRERLN